MLKKILPILLILSVCAGLGHQAIAQRMYPGSGRAFTRDEMGEMTADSGSVAAGLVAYIDSANYLQTATWYTDYLNRVQIGISTGAFRKMRTSGIVEDVTCIKIGAPYWLGPGGSLIDTVPKGQSVWIVRMGRCVDSLKLLLDSPITAIRREGDG